jgi:ferredoxin
MKVEVNSDRCMGHGMCQALVPEVFTVNAESGVNEMGRFDVNDSLAPGVRRGISGCPEQAIAILDGDS